jgi:hypothetical protein
MLFYQDKRLIIIVMLTKMLLVKIVICNSGRNSQPATNQQSPKLSLIPPDYANVGHGIFLFAIGVMVGLAAPLLRLLPQRLLVWHRQV